MTFAQRHRYLLIANMAKGPQPILQEFALKHIFPDITIAEWCNDFGVKVEPMTVGNYDNRETRGAFYSFYVFSFEEEDKT